MYQMLTYCRNEYKQIWAMNGLISVRIIICLAEAVKTNLTQEIYTPKTLFNTTSICKNFRNLSIEKKLKFYNIAPIQPMRSHFYLFKIFSISHFKISISKHMTFKVKNGVIVRYFAFIYWRKSFKEHDVLWLVNLRRSWIQIWISNIFQTCDNYSWKVIDCNYN